METVLEVPDLEIKSVQTATQCHEDYTKKQTDAHRQFSVHTRKLDLVRDMELKCKIQCVGTEHSERHGQQLPRERSLCVWGAQICYLDGALHRLP